MKIRITTTEAQRLEMKDVALAQLKDVNERFQITDPEGWQMFELEGLIERIVFASTRGQLTQ